MQLKKLLSYIYPIRIKTLPSERSNSLEITMVNGKLLLDSKHTNYSYGSLQKVLNKGLAHIGKNIISKCEHILILGVAGGSIIQTLKNEYKTNAQIDAVEIDYEIIELAKTYFNLTSYTNLNIIIDDASKYIKTTKKSYDLIIVDIFNDNRMPDFLFEDNFWKLIYKKLNNNGLCLFNSMISLKDIDAKNEQLKDTFKALFVDTTEIVANQKHNKLFILKK